MSIFYVCIGYDEYDPNTGLFVFKTDCIEWNTDTMGPFNGPTYQSQSECYEQSICAPSPTTNTNNPTSSCQIKEVSLIDKSNDIITVNIQLFQDYDNAYIEYAIYDIDQNLIQNFRRLNIKSNILLQNDNYIIGIKNINNNSLGGCPPTISLSGWEAVHKVNWEPGVPPSQWVNPPDFIYKNINGTYTNLGIDAQGFSWYRSDNYGRWDLDPDGNNTWTYTANIDTDAGLMNSAVDRWYISMTNEPFPITAQLAWGISFGELSDTYISTRVLAFGTPGELCPTDIDLSNLTLYPLPTNINDPTKRWSGITKIGDILCDDGGSGSGSESGFDICRLAFRLITKCSEDNENGGSDSGSDSGSDN